jgi:hypothetical protein
MRVAVFANGGAAAPGVANAESKLTDADERTSVRRRSRNLRSLSSRARLAGDDPQDRL